MNDKQRINEAYKAIYAKNDDTKEDTKEEVLEEGAPFHTVNVELGYADLSYILDAIINYSSNPKFPGRGLDKSDQGLLSRLRVGLQKVTNLERKQEEMGAAPRTNANRFMSQMTTIDHP